MNPKYTTILSKYSLAAGKVGKPIGEPVVTEYPTGKAALAALNAAINKHKDKRGQGTYFFIGTPDGRKLPLDTAYFEIFGVRPAYRSGDHGSYPLLNK